MQPTVVFRPRSAAFYSVAFWIASALLVLAFALNGGIGEVLRFAPVALTLAAVGWAVFWRPAVGVAPDGVVLINPFRTVEIPWDRVAEVESRWGLRIRTSDGRRYRATGAPARGGFEHRHRDRFPQEALDEHRSTTVRLPGDADVVGRVLELRLDERRTRAATTGGEAPKVRVRAAVAPLVAVLGGGALAAVLIAWPF